MSTCTRPSPSFLFVVRPKGSRPETFPADMLRYDACEPADEVSRYLVETRNAKGRSIPTLSGIALRSLRSPTPERWESFGWSVVSVTREKVKE